MEPCPLGCVIIYEIFFRKKQFVLPFGISVTNIFFRFLSGVFGVQIKLDFFHFC